MTPNARLAPHGIVLSLLVAVGVWATWLAPSRNDPCAHPDVLEVTGLIPGSKPGGERQEKLGRNVIQWSEGLVPDPDLPRNPLEFRIVRSYDVLKASEHVLALLDTRLEPESLRVETVEAPGSRLPVHLIRTTGGGNFSVVAYLLLLGNEPVSDPLLAQLRHAARDLRDGARPVTVILAGGPANPDTVAAREDLALRWITAAWQHYQAICTTKAPR